MVCNGSSNSQLAGGCGLMLINVYLCTCATELPGSQPAHLHLHQQESIEVHEGQLGYWIGNPVHHATAGQGDVVIIQQGNEHLAHSFTAH